MGRRTRVLVMEELEPMAVGIKLMLERDPDMEVVAQVWPSHGIVPPLSRFSCDVVVWGCPIEQEGSLLSFLAQTQSLSVPVVVTISRFEEEYFLYMEKGVHGFVMKNDIEALSLAIRTVCRGGFYFCRECRDMLHTLVMMWKRTREKAPLSDLLTEMEIRVIRELIKDKTNQEIADALFISKRTVEYYITSAIQKLGVNSRVGLVTKALVASEEMIAPSIRPRT